MRVLDPFPKIKKGDDWDSKNVLKSSGVSIMVNELTVPDCSNDVNWFAGIFFRRLIGLPLYSGKPMMQRLG
jgi:hypothetical protein